MTEISASGPERRDAAHGGTLYRMVWKWHFLASLYVLPFMAMLSLTGGIYLYKPQIEAWLYADRMTVTPQDDTLSLEEQAATLQVGRIRGITLTGADDTSTVIEYDTSDGVRSLAWVNPYDGNILGSVARDEMAMQVVRKIHGELLLGDFGTKFVELAAHWAVVMFVTGIILWWPRGSRRLSDAIRPPRGSPKTRNWWRETHLFTGMLATILIVPIIISGLPWTDIWGGSLDRVQQATGQSSKSLRFGSDTPKSLASQGDTIPWAQVIETARAQDLVYPLEMRPPRKADDAFWIRSASTNRTDQTELVIDRYSGAVLARVDFADNPPVARAVSWGISFHQGEAYGWLNLAQNTIAAILGVALSLSGFVAWWKRRPAGSLGVPAAPEASLGTGMIILAIALMILFPLMGASLIIVLILDWLIFQRVGWFRPKAL
ncbi:PepSY-associated TM helix domain-containing protein [Pseudaestuariivita rosea]|uniref:PepSY-associated TM helix domain-containing protein n=1 Tax=Pseudaestuariivita rosea TaxID=2763263 RepID=UPI001ABA8723|nr:PepSY domain-containing protein [Pseudaestuariivita rosea]